MQSKRLDHDWFSRPLPDNIELGERTWLYSSYAFTHYGSRAPVALRVGSDTGLYHGTFFDVGPDAEIEIGNFCSLVGVIFATNGRVTIGDYTFIAHDVVIADTAWQTPDDYGLGCTLPPAMNARQFIDIGKNVWIGAQAVIVGNIRIGEGAIIGAGALVAGDVPPYSLCVGNPMRILRKDEHGNIESSSASGNA
jgi:acetyltransferase-like isoleucine patch superfamily enzyme